MPMLCALGRHGRALAIQASGCGEKLELKVVGITEHDGRVGERFRLVPDGCVCDPQLVEPGHPGFKVGTRADLERHVVQSCPEFEKSLVLVAVLVCNPITTPKSGVINRTPYPVDSR